jgi:hypothetical protein
VREGNIFNGTSVKSTALKPEIMKSEFEIFFLASISNKTVKNSPNPTTTEPCVNLIVPGARVVAGV